MNDLDIAGLLICNGMKEQPNNLPG